MSDYSFKDGILKTPEGIAAVSSEIIFPQLMEGMISELEAAISRAEKAERSYDQSLDAANRSANKLNQERQKNDSLKAQLSEANIEIERLEDRQTDDQLINAVSTYENRIIPNLNNQIAELKEQLQKQGACQHFIITPHEHAWKCTDCGFVLQDDNEHWQNHYKLQVENAKLQQQLDSTLDGRIISGLYRENSELKEQVEGLSKNAAFYRSCALSGEIPKAGDQPYIPELVESPPTGEDVDNE